MRARMTRHLFGLSKTQGGAESKQRVTLTAAWQNQRADFCAPPEFSPRDYVVYLLQMAAEIEHSLMVQYLYAAYSLGGPAVPERHRATVEEWREVVLGIAKEEMGHLISVENVLRLLGGAVHLDREDYPWGTEFYPFPFKLERLSIESLARYVYAESPEAKDWAASELPLREEIVRLATQGGGESQLHRVGELFELLIGRVADPRFLNDEEFDASTYTYQASWDEWGRGYRAGQRGNTTGAAPKATPDVIVAPLSSRDDAVAALRAIASQGEAPSMAQDQARSHFRRFLDIYKRLRQIREIEPGFEFSRPLAENPRTPRDPAPGADRSAPQDWSDGDAHGAFITHPAAREWAHLLNLRYRMLLAYLTHAYSLSGALVRAGQLTMRGTIVNFTFGEMYNLSTISGMLVDLPLGDGRRSAGPPFEMPYSLPLPASEHDRYRLHRDLLAASRSLIDQIAKRAAKRDYLASLRAADDRALESVEQCIRHQRLSGGSP
jgi:hypothetical protein